MVDHPHPVADRRAADFCKLGLGVLTVAADGYDDGNMVIAIPAPFR
jgi:hypothetical protein